MKPFVGLSIKEIIFNKVDLISSDDLTALKSKIYEEYNKDRVFFTSTINNNGIEELKKARPNYSILSEEFGIEKNKDKNNTWIIDPIDGTVNFLHGIPHFAISIALQSHEEIICGLIFDPIKNEMFYAEKDSGAFFNNHRVRVSKKNQINDCLFVTGGKVKNELDLPYRKSGCAALDMAYVAAGRYDGYFQYKLNIWDIAAGVILIKEAGGIINDIDLTVNENIKVIASSPDINDKLHKKLVNF